MSYIFGTCCIHFPNCPSDLHLTVMSSTSGQGGQGGGWLGGGLIELGEDVDCEARDYRSVEVEVLPIHAALGV
jgi:hypothetical protein